jgi:hypothetical protein
MKISSHNSVLVLVLASVVGVIAGAGASLQSVVLIGVTGGLAAGAASRVLFGKPAASR